MSKNQYINTLSQQMQEAIYKKLREMDNLENHDINNAMNSRISDLEEIISFEEIEALWVNPYAHIMGDK